MTIADALREIETRQQAARNEEEKRAEFERSLFCVRDFRDTFCGSVNEHTCMELARRIVDLCHSTEAIGKSDRFSAVVEEFARMIDRFTSACSLG